MKISYYGHACFMLEGSKKIIIDPFLTGNPTATKKPEYIKADYILISHGHGDHLGDGIKIARQSGGTIIAPNELAVFCEQKGAKVHNMHIGGAYIFDGVKVKLTQAWHGSAFQKFAFFLMMIGFGFLVPMWPLHTWSPDGHVAAPTAVSMLHAGVLMKLGGYGLIRVGLACFPEGAHYWAPLIATLCCVNATYGAFVAMVQKDLKFVIGYSSVSHMGYVLLGISAMNAVGIDGAVAQMFAHGIMTALFFAIVGNIYNKAHTRMIAEFGGLAHQMPRVAYSFLIAGLASLGLPGLYNFVAEFAIFMGAIQVYPVRAFISVFAIVITAIYVLRVMMRVFFGPRNPRWDDLKDARGVEIVPFIILSGTLILFGVFPDLLMNMIDNGVVPLAEKLATFKMGGIF
jgi:NADH-quinone oxidoreductase subunit M